VVKTLELYETIFETFCPSAFSSSQGPRAASLSSFEEQFVKKRNGKFSLKYLHIIICSLLADLRCSRFAMQQNQITTRCDVTWGYVLLRNIWQPWSQAR
jgi:hypothetical protein